MRCSNRAVWHPRPRKRGRKLAGAIASSFRSVSVSTRTQSDTRSRSGYQVCARALPMPDFPSRSPTMCSSPAPRTPQSTERMRSSHSRAFGAAQACSRRFRSAQDELRWCHSATISSGSVAGNARKEIMQLKRFCQKRRGAPCRPIVPLCTCGHHDDRQRCTKLPPHMP